MGPVNILLLAWNGRNIIEKIKQMIPKKHATCRAQLDEETKSKIQADDTKNYATGRAQLDQETKSKIQANNDGPTDEQTLS